MAVSWGASCKVLRSMHASQGGTHLPASAPPPGVADQKRAAENEQSAQVPSPLTPTRVMPVSSARISCVLRANLALKSVGSAIACTKAQP